MITVDYNLGFKYRKSGFDESVKKELDPALRKIDEMLSKKLGYHIGEEVILVKSYVSKKTGKRVWLDDKYFESDYEHDWCCFYIAGFCEKTKSLVVARMFRDSNYPKHFRIKNLKFLAKFENAKVLLAKRSGKNG